MATPMDLEMEKINYNPLSLVPKSDLKSARLVCKAWRVFANELLFETVYISANQNDIDVFLGIAGSEWLPGCVKKLIYDATGFTPHFPRSEYLRRLSTLWEPFIKNTGRPSPFDPDNEQISGFLENSEDENPVDISLQIPEDVEWLRYKLEDGYLTYATHAERQQQLMDSDEFAAALLHGLGRFNNLESVEFGYQWTTEAVGLDKSKTGSPLMRSWDPWHCRPHLGFPSEERTAGESRSATNGAFHGRVLVDALVRANEIEGNHKMGLLRTIKMRIGPMWIFDQQTALGSEMTRLSTVTGGLERFVLQVPSHVETLNRPNIDGLTHLLGSMRQLQELDLSLPTRNLLEDSDEMPIYYSISELFPVSTSWDKLETLRIRGVSSTSATELLHCLQTQMPRLTCLTIGEIALYEGTWREVFEALKGTRQLHELELEEGVVLWCNGARDTYVNTLPMDIALDIESFVEAGGDNPFEIMDRAIRDELDQQYADSLFGSGMDTDVDMDTSDTAEESEL